MTLQQLFTQFRIEAFDNSLPQLFPDPELTMWFNEAQVEAAIRAKLLRETSNVLLTQFDIRQGVMLYPIDPRMFEIDYASLTYKGSNGMLPYVLALTTPQELDGVRPYWRTLPYRPTGVIAYDTQLGTDALPDTAYTIKVEGYRLPMAAMDTLATAEVLATGSVTLTAGTTGTVATVTVNGLDVLGSPVAFNTSLTQTAADVVTQINLNQNKYVASSLGAIITLTDLPTAGSAHNGHAVTATFTGTLTATTVAFAGGVDAVVTSPEISPIHHRHLVEWALHRAYQKPDTETFDPEKSNRALKRFREYFGERPDATNRKGANASRPHRNLCYG
jgi:hypothetical protein